MRHLSLFSGIGGFDLAAARMGLSELDGITFSKWRNESLKAHGNAIVPQVAFQIFKAIQEYTIKC